MLRSNEHGYAVMNKELTSYSIEDISIEVCKRYCRNGDVIVRQIPYVAGLTLRVVWRDWWRPFEFNKRGMQGNLLWLHINWDKVYLHKTGEIVYSSNTKN